MPLTLTIRPGRNGAHIVDVSGPDGIVRSIPLIPGSTAARQVAGFVVAVHARVNAAPVIAAAAPPSLRISECSPALVAMPRMREDA